MVTILALGLTRLVVRGTVVAAMLCSARILVGSVSCEGATMNDPHVVALYYDLKTALQFDNPPPVDESESEFDRHLENNRLTATMKAHYASMEAARAVVEPLLRAWEIRAALDCQLHGLEWRFVFDQPNIIDASRPLVRCRSQSPHS